MNFLVNRHGDIVTFILARAQRKRQVNSYRVTLPAPLQPCPKHREAERFPLTLSLGNTVRASPIRNRIERLQHHAVRGQE
jgi:hypothetical protein